MDQRKYTKFWAWSRSGTYYADIVSYIVQSPTNMKNDSEVGKTIPVGLQCEKNLDRTALLHQTPVHTKWRDHCESSKCTPYIVNCKYLMLWATMTFVSTSGVFRTWKIGAHGHSSFIKFISKFHSPSPTIFNMNLSVFRLIHFLSELLNKKPLEAQESPKYATGFDCVYLLQICTCCCWGAH